MSFVILILLALSIVAAAAAFVWAFLADRREAHTPGVNSLRFYAPSIDPSKRSIMRYLVVRAGCGDEEDQEMAERWLRAS
ncbi:MAG: hypothetical protein KKF41_08185 [Actinobacteria bacterium]|nr:hypothetical protein [Actinomycetota bacterium]MBU1943541.1 hypothetical protein [Actinomycetota bacterium]MBU2687550.1 hypothetical protein [Actinomycetota bacterium]